MPVTTSEIVEPYFSHDITCRFSKEFVKLINSMGYEGYGIYWATVEFMYRNELEIGEENLVLGEQYADKVKQILNDYQLFRTENNYYVSDRIIRNIEKQNEKFKLKSEAANRRWILSRLKKSYVEIFETEPVLNSDEIEKYIDYVNTIQDFEKRLPDILYTTKLLKFKNNPDFHGSINWLLKENHLTTLLNGGYGEIKSWSKHLEYLKNKNTPPEEKEPEFDINTISSKAEAIDYIKREYSTPAEKLTIPPIKYLMKKFDITKQELT